MHYAFIRICSKAIKDNSSRLLIYLFVCLFVYLLYIEGDIL